MHSTAYYVSPAGAVTKIDGNTWDHQAFQDKHKPQGWRGPFTTPGDARRVIRAVREANLHPLVGAIVRDTSVDRIDTDGALQQDISIRYAVGEKGYLCLATGAWAAYDSAISGPEFFTNPVFVVEQEPVRRAEAPLASGARA